MQRTTYEKQVLRNSPSFVSIQACTEASHPPPPLLIVHLLASPLHLLDGENCVQGVHCRICVVRARDWERRPVPRTTLNWYAVLTLLACDSRGTDVVVGRLKGSLVLML